MTHYIDIKVLPDGEFSAQTLLNEVYGKLHLALVNIGKETVGVSFPELDEKINRLGATIRIHGPARDIEPLAETSWLMGVRDFAALTPVTEVPAKTRYRTISRVQVKSNPEKERRRLMKRKGISEEEALRLIPDSKARTTKLPFIQMKSLSSSKRFMLFIRHGEITDTPVPGTFTKYGLSSEATIPWF